MTEQPAPRLVLHIGTHKTGTSSIQELLAQQADFLLSRGIFYPVAVDEEYPDQHSAIALCLKLEKWKRAEALIAEVQRRFAASGASTLVLSGEEFSTLDVSYIGVLRERFSNFDTRTILVRRSLGDYLMSQYKHHLRFETYVVTPWSFALRLGDTELDAGRVEGIWRAVFGSSSLRSLEYTSHGHDLLAAFIAASEALPMELLEMAGPRSNVSTDLFSGLCCNLSGVYETRHDDAFTPERAAQVELSLLTQILEILLSQSPSVTTRALCRAELIRCRAIR